MEDKTRLKIYVEDYQTAKRLFNILYRPAIDREREVDEEEWNGIIPIMVFRQDGDQIEIYKDAGDGNKMVKEIESILSDTDIEFTTRQECDDWVERESLWIKDRMWENQKALQEIQDIIWEITDR